MNPRQPCSAIGHISVSYHDKIIIWGGYTVNRSVHRWDDYIPPDIIWVFQPLVGIWSAYKTTGDIPGATSGATACIVDSHLYLFGGFSMSLDEPEDRSSFHLHRLDLISHKWTLLRPSGDILPCPCDKVVSWEFNNEFYIYGGFGSQSTRNNRCNFIPDEEHHGRGWIDQLLKYNRNENKWFPVVLKSMKPYPRAAHAAAKIGSKVYIFGGRSMQTRLNEFYCIDMEKLCCSQVYSSKGDDVPSGRSWHSLTPISDHQLVLYGGFDQNDVPLRECWIFDTNNSSWRQMNSGKIIPLLWHTASPISYNEVIIYGGYKENICNPLTEGSMNTDIIMIRSKPQPLFGLCLEFLQELPDLYLPYWNQIPRFLHTLLNQKRIQKFIKIP